MAVIQISRIQHRRGLQENLPQLASAEFGWSIDQRRLFIGNGTISEGAPIPGNTEILTQYTDIASVLSSYTFKGDESGYLSQTAAGAAQSITRTLQHKLDEQISVRDFGAKGDGFTDDTAAIQRALSQVYPVGFYASAGVRRILHFPAGVYVITDTLKVPSYSHLIGDGIASSVIQQVGSSAVVAFADSKGQIGGNLGTNSAVAPTTVTIAGLTIQNTTDYDVVQLDSASNITFDYSELKGYNASPLALGSGMAALRIQSTISPVKNIMCNRCIFTQVSYGVYATGDVTQVSVEDSILTYLYRGISLGATCNSVKVFNNLFDKISSVGLGAYSGSSTVSFANYYKDVGNSLIGVSNPSFAVIEFEGASSHSIGDMFDRDSLSSVSAIASLSGTTGITVQNAAGTLRYGSGQLALLVDNTAGNVAAISNSVVGGILDYSLSRGANNRMGTIRFSQGGGTVQFEEDFTEHGASTGVQFSFAVSGSTVLLRYLTTALGQNTILKYQLRNFG